MLNTSERIAQIRHLADLLQFSSLLTTAEQAFNETFDSAMLPLMAMACMHLSQRERAMQLVSDIESDLARLDIDGCIDLAGVYALMLRVDDSKSLLETALKTSPKHPLGLARLAWCEMQLGQLARAKDLYLEAAMQAPHRLLTWTAFIRLSLEDKETTEAQQALDKALEQYYDQRGSLASEVSDAFAVELRQLQIEVWVAANKKAEAEAWLTACKSDLNEGDWLNLVGFYSNVLANQHDYPLAEQVLKDALSEVPDALELISQLADLAYMQGRTQQTVALLQRCITLSEQEIPSIRFWIRLSSACLNNFDKQARKAAEKALELAHALEVGPDLPEQMIHFQLWQAKNTLAQVECQERNFDISTQIFTAILRENPCFVPSLRGLGQQKMQQGDIEGAVVLFERVKALDPILGHSALINAQQFPEDIETLKQMERVARQSNAGGKPRPSILFQLASAWEKKKAFDKAFELAQLANDTSRAALAYSPFEHRQRCARIRYAFNKALYEHRPSCGVDSTLPIFVVGMPRSGTTLIEQILAGHSKIFGAGELGLIPQRIQGLNSWERHIGSGRAYPDCIDDLDAYATKGIANGILDELKELAATEKPEAKYVIDKLPHNFENIGFIKFLFPNARIISVRRDPRDIAISNYFTDFQAKHSGMGFAYSMEWIGWQLADHNLLMHHWHQTFPGDILEINYEDVIEDTEAAARQLLGYIGVDWEPKVLDFYELDRLVKTASYWQVRQPIYKTSKAKWTRYESHLAPLIKATNAKITWDDIGMVTLPEASLLQVGFALYHDQDLDAAEYKFRQLLHYLPDHAAANYMVGEICLRKNLLLQGIELIEKALELAPWKREWHNNLIQAYELTGQVDKLKVFNTITKRTSTDQSKVDDESARETNGIRLDSAGFIQIDL